MNVCVYKMKEAVMERQAGESKRQTTRALNCLRKCKKIQNKQKEKRNEWKKCGKLKVPNRHVLIEIHRREMGSKKKKMKKNIVYQRKRCRQMAPRKSIVAIKRCSNTGVDFLEVGQLWKKFNFFPHNYGVGVADCIVFIFKLAIFKDSGVDNSGCWGRSLMLHWPSNDYFFFR